MLEVVLCQLAGERFDTDSSAVGVLRTFLPIGIIQAPEEVRGFLTQVT